MQAGTRLGHFEVLSALGKGGMGEVWRARDVQLGRQVAIKALPAELVQDPERLTRFEREARLLAAVNHPSIAVIHGLEEAAGERFLVLELVEGETLADRLKRGAIPVEQSLELARQIAEALEAAHDKGVVHRDLKPANVMVLPQGKVKVLDFGLAKAFGGAEHDAALSDSPTLSLAATQRGVVLGTAAYMAPEQARGAPADVRADVWAFGCVLFEMLSGQRAFDGDTTTDILAGVLRAEPDWQRLPPDLHPRIRYLLERCLEKNADGRCQRITEARFEIEKALRDPDAASVRSAGSAQEGRRAMIRWAAVFAVLLLSALAIGIAAWSPRPLASADVIRLVDALPEVSPGGMLQAPLVDISRDGRRVAYSVGAQIFIRDLEQPEARPLQGPTGFLSSLRFSPDGRWLIYVQGPPPFSVQRVPVSGGTPQPVLRTLAVPHSVDWDERGLLLFVQPEGIFEVSPEGGEPRLIVAAAEGEELASPRLLPGGRAVLFTATTAAGTGRWDAGRVMMQSLSTGERTLVWAGGSDARYLPSGHLVYAQGSALFAVPFDPDRGRLLGSPVQVVAQMTRAPGSNPWSDTAQYSVADNGTLARLTIAGEAPRRRLAWVYRDGRREVLPVRPDDYTMVRISADGRQAALVGGDPFDEARNPEIAIVDLETHALRQLTFDSAADAPVWTPGGDRLYFRSMRSGAEGVYSVPAAGGEPEKIAAMTDAHPFAFPASLSPDGQTLVLISARTLEDINLATLRLDGDAQFSTLLSDPQQQSEPDFAANGVWLAYTEQGRIGVRPFPDVRRTLHRVADGSHPAFSRDGTELFYFDGSGIAAVPVQYEPDLRIGSPRTLFREQYWYGVGGPDGSFGRAWDPHPDGSRFLMILMPDDPSDEVATRLHVVVNWTKELERDGA